MFDTEAKKFAHKVQESKTVVLFPDLTLVNIDKFPKEVDLGRGFRLVKFDGSLLLSKSLESFIGNLGIGRKEIRKLVRSPLAFEADNPDEKFINHAYRLSVVMRIIRPVKTIPVQISYRDEGSYYEVTAMRITDTKIYPYHYKHRLPRESHFRPEDLEDLKKFWKILSKLYEEQEGRKKGEYHKFLRSVDFSEASYKQVGIWLKLVLLVTSLEALFTTSGNVGISYALRTRMAKFLKGEKDQKKTFDFIREMYKIRSGIVHGGVPKELLDEKIISDVVELENLLRMIYRKILDHNLMTHFKDNETAEKYLDGLVIKS